MAKMLIQGTDGGYKVFYPIEIGDSSFNPLTKDERSLFYTKDWLLYSVTIVGNGCILSTYRYVQERRNDGTDGYVAFSFFLPDNSLIKKGDAKALLDELSGSFFNKYVDVEDNNRLHQVPVSGCLYLESILDKYQFCGSNPILNQHQEKVSYAFVVCDDDEEIGSYLNNPFQSEYDPYKQVFFVEKRFRGCLLLPDTANLTGKIDLENPRYKLILRHDFSNSGLDVEVRANRKRKYNEDWVYRKEILTITYSKEYCDSLVLKGKITDADLQPYLEIDEDNRSIIVKRDVELKQASKKVMIVVTDLKGRPVEDVEVKVLPQRDNPRKKTPENDGGYVFVGVELGGTFTVTASKNGLSGSKTFVPNQVEENVLSLIIQKRKLISFTIQDDKDGSALYGCNITVKDKKSLVEKKAFIKDKLTYEFLGDEIGKEYVISVNKNRYQPEDIIICPEDITNDPYYIGLIQKEEKRRDSGQPAKQYRLVIDENKGYRDGISDYETNINRIPNIKPKARKGYRFIKWEDHRDQSYDQCDGHFIAIFEETWWHRNLSLLRLTGIIGAILIIVFIVLLLTVWKKESEMPLQRMTKEAFAHVEDSINDCGNDIEKLEALQKRWSGYESGIVKEGGFLGMGGAIDEEAHLAWQTGMEKIEEAINNEKAKKEATEELRKEIEDYVDGDELFFNKLSDYKSKVENDENLKCDEMLVSRLNSCIQLRKLLDEGKILQIKSYDFNYSMEQQQLINAIKGIPDNYISYVSGKLRGNITTKTINEVVKFINDKVKEKEKMDNRPIPAPQPSDPPQNTTTQQQLETEFWELISQKADKTRFDDLFMKSGWNNSPNFKGFYNKYLSWKGPMGNKQKPNNNEIFNYREGFEKVPTVKLQECSRDKDLDKLTGFVIDELKK